VPSDKGYRFYVQTIGEGIELDPEAARRLRTRFARAGHAMDDWVEAAGQMLAELADSMAVVTFPSASRARLRQIEMVPLRDLLAMLIVVLQGARLMQQLVPLSEPVSQDELKAVGNKLSALYAGLDRGQMRERKAELSPLEAQAKEGTLAAMQEADEDAYDPHIDGLRRLMRQPELGDEERVGVLMDLVEERVVLRRVLAQAAESGHIQVIIGTENDMQALWPFSLVLCPYGLRGELAGILGVLGPTRLAYISALGGVRLVSDLMTETVSAI
jgi:heat-inducible transcriptional repressor